MKIKDILEEQFGISLRECGLTEGVIDCLKAQAEIKIKALFDVEDIIDVLLRKEMEITKSTGFDATRRELAETLKEWWEKK